jgi:hypothetical protein
VAAEVLIKAIVPDPAQAVLHTPDQVLQAIARQEVTATAVVQDPLVAVTAAAPGLQEAVIAVVPGLREAAIVVVPGPLEEAVQVAAGHHRAAPEGNNLKHNCLELSNHSG